MKNNSNTANISNISAAVCTLGCKVNQYESDCLISEFSRLGFEIKDFSEFCDVYVINTCTVTAQSDKKSRQMIRRAKKSNPNAVVAVCGCFSQINPEYFKESSEADIVAGTTEKIKIPQMAREILKNKNTELHTINFIKDISEYREYENINAYSSEKIRAYIKIQDGCNAKCSYCIIPTARGRVTSRRYDDILAEVKRFNNMGYHEIVFAGIEIASYGDDLKNIDLISLLEKLDAEPLLENILSMRLSSIDPAYISRDFTDRFAKLKKTANHFHISLQSGSDKILRLMRRKYNIRTVLSNLEYAKDKIRDLNITADIIVGFPKETDEDFHETVNAIEKLNVYHTHIFTYSKRPNTEAANFGGQIDESIKNTRSRELFEFCEKIKCSMLKNIANFPEKCYDVIVENYHDNASNGEKYYTAKTKNYIDVKIYLQDKNDKSDKADIIGKAVSVKVIGCDSEFLLCQIRD